MTPALARKFAAYNCIMNDKVYGVVAALSDAERKQPRGAFFGSVHGTLNHLLWADQVWLARFDGQPAPGGGTRTEVASEFELLRQLRTLTDQRISEFAERLTHERLESEFSWTNSKGTSRSAPLFVLVAHLFNHQTHHRGQLTTLLSQMGLDVGVTDLFALV
jgi:uncharacterized damage-inducible protein DinB